MRNGRAGIGTSGNRKREKRGEESVGSVAAEAVWPFVYCFRSLATEFYY
jgi:hypothetical protein